MGTNFVHSFGVKTKAKMPSEIELPLSKTHTLGIISSKSVSDYIWPPSSFCHNKYNYQLGIKVNQYGT